MDDERLWERLVEFLAGWARAVEVAPGRIEVTLQKSAGVSRSVVIVMTPAEWDDMVTILWGDFDRAAQVVRAAVLGLRRHERFLVYGQYELVPSATPELPVDAELAHRREQGRWHPAPDTGSSRTRPAR